MGFTSFFGLKLMRIIRIFNILNGVNIFIKLYKKNKMEFISESKSGIYEVEKIITRKFFKSKKYYLIKWLCYPIYESTWEPKSNLKDLDFMIN